MPYQGGARTFPEEIIRRLLVGRYHLIVFGTGSLIWSEQYLPPGLAAVVVATVPLWFVVLDKYQWKYYFSNKLILLGLLIGFAGVVTLFIGKGSAARPTPGGGDMRLISIIVLLFGSVCWALGSLYSKYVKVGESANMKASIQMIAAGLVSFIPAFCRLASSITLHGAIFLPPPFAAVLFTWLFFGSLIGFISYIWLLSVRPPSLVGTYAYVNPAVALLLEQSFWQGK